MFLVFIVAAFAAAYLVFSHIYGRRWDKDLTVDLFFPKKEIFEGECGEIQEKITNAKLTPLLFGNISFRVPRFLSFNGLRYSQDIYREERTTLFSYEQLIRRLPFTALKRGCYELSDVCMATDDLLFRYRYLHHSNASCSITVFPRVRGVENFPIDFRRLTGDVVSRRSMIEDPFFFRGIRDWTPVDSMRRINWIATARTGELKVNEFESTCSLKVLLLIDFDGYNQGDHDEVREDMIRIAAYLAGKLLESGVPVGLAANTPAEQGKRLEVSFQSGRSHYHTLLRAMAQIDTKRLSGPFCEVLDSFKQMDDNTQYIIISFYADSQLDERILRLNQTEMTASWILLHDKSRRVSFTPRSKIYPCEMEY